MKFAIRKLAISCVLPAALWQGPFVTDVFAQNFPTASSKIGAGMPQKRTTPARNTAKAPPARPTAPATDSQPQYPAAARSQGAANANTVYQVANPALQQQSQPGGNGGGAETDVQRQLRMLYEKSGQEMPVMDLSEMEVPEPQPGVAPGRATDGSEGASPAPGQFAQPPVPPQKNPNFFERVFLGKKAPPPRPAPQTRAPVVPAPQIRPAQPIGVQPGTPPATNYRPYQPGQPNQQLPQGYNGQRPGVMNQPGAPVQPNGYPQQPAPQVQLQRPVGQPQVIPPPFPPQQQPQLQRPAVQPQIQTPPQYNPQPTTGGAQVAPPQSPPLQDDVPVLDEEPEESLEIDLNPKVAPAVQDPATQVEKPSGVIPSPLPTTTAVPQTADTKPAGPSEPAPAEENPFSGLKLSIPESAVPAPANSGAPAVQITPSKANTPAVPSSPPALELPVVPETPAATTTPRTNSAVTPPAANRLPAKDNPFLDDEDLFEQDELIEKSKQPASPDSVKATGQPPVVPAPGVAKPFEIAPIQPPAPGKAAAPASKSIAAPAARIDQPVAAKTAAANISDERLKKLAEAPEKSGLKGFCPVVLRQKGQLIESKPQFNATYKGKKFHFSSIAAKAAFEKEPQLFAPVYAGLDAVALLDEKASLPGSLDHAVWYQGHLYLFSSRENREIFVSEPELYLDEDDSEPTPTKTVSTPAPAAQPTRRPQKAKPVADVAPAAESTVNTPPKAAPVSDDLPVLSDNLDDLPPLLPITSDTPEPAANRPAARTPALTPTDAGNTIPTTQDAPVPVAPKPVTPPAVKPPVVQPGPQLELPVLKNATKNTPASFVVPTSTNRSRGTPPKLISPDLRLAPSVRQ